MYFSSSYINICFGRCQSVGNLSHGALSYLKSTLYTHSLNISVLLRIVEELIIFLQLNKTMMFKFSLYLPTRYLLKPQCLKRVMNEYALGPILPQLQVFGKQLGISSVIMGTVTGILPFAYLLAKPLFGIIVDVYRDYRKTIFMALIVVMAVSYSWIIFIPERSLKVYDVKIEPTIKKCDNIENAKNVIGVECTSKCFQQSDRFQIHSILPLTQNVSFQLCATDIDIQAGSSQLCEFKCRDTSDVPNDIILKSLSFWFFVASLSIGTIAFNVANSISDAVCFDVIGDEYDYGKQRTLGSVGYGLTALLSGYAMDNFLIGMEGYKPAICIMLIFTILDLLSCLKLKLPIIPAPKNIWKDLRNLMQYKAVCIFLIFTIIAGTADGFLTYFLLWYVEDISELTGTKNIKLLEGLIIAAENLGGDILFFYIGDNILKKLGHVNCFSVCFLFYAFRLIILSLVSSPWSIIAIEFLLQGPTFALTYVTIVAYANEIAPPGTSATMQGIAAGLDDGLGYALGSLLGGILYRYTGPRQTFQIFCVMSAVAGIAHFLIQKYCLDNTDENTIAPEEAQYSSVPQTCHT
ncbi:hypothetical protein HHI36_011560 [Cryptolaemus montrouzieri]|uniref:Major facilitator superfamily (MFS) profile domain-containing protein n=1 Tax=Cryptolaemus montrouzieri TaxID=559131 RepID=A0ABD2MM47_9CUCU